VVGVDGKGGRGDTKWCRTTKTPWMGKSTIGERKILGKALVGKKIRLQRQSHSRKLSDRAKAGSHDQPATGASEREKRGGQLQLSPLPANKSRPGSRRPREPPRQASLKRPRGSSSTRIHNKKIRGRKEGTIRMTAQGGLRGNPVRAGPIRPRRV